MVARLVAVVFYAALAVVLLAFIFTNREPTELSLFPLGVSLVMPLYVALGLLFIIGLMLGLSYSALVALKYKRRAWRDARLINQLERELSLKAETNPRIGHS